MRAFRNFGGWGRAVWGACVLAALCPAVWAQTDPGPVDLTNREAARQWFNTWWPKTYGAPMGFTGDVANGIPGDISQAYRDQTLLRINLYRRMAGEQPVVTDPTYNTKSQAAAVLCAANDQLSHSPPTNWKFYTPTAAEGCQNSDLGGGGGPSGIYGLIVDGGSSNLGAGHRQHLLTPDLSLIGIGSSPSFSESRLLVQGTIAVWINDPSMFSADRNYRDPFVLWPSRGYVPHYMVPGRWSIAIPDAGSSEQLDLSDVSISVQKDGVSVPVNTFRSSGAVSATFTIDGTDEGNSGFEPIVVNGEEIFTSPRPPNDINYHIALSNIRQRSNGALWNGDGFYQYNVTVYDPYSGTIIPGATSILSNLSTRSFAGAGSATQIAGFVIAGSSARKVLVRAGGPYLSKFGVDGFLPDPKLTIYAGSSPIKTNDNWGSDAAQIQEITSKVGATPFADGSKDAAIVAVLNPGIPYTAQVTSGDTVVGNAIVEVYDADSDASSNLVNISTRSYVGTGSGIQIGGFILRGSGPRRVLIRAGGPYLSQYGVSPVLADPILSVYLGNTKIAENDDWSSNISEVVSAETAVNVPAYSPGSKDSALVLTLDPDKPYTAQVSGKDGTTGNALIEIFSLP